MGWTIYLPSSAIEKMVDMPPYKTIPDELTELKSLKKLNLSKLRVKALPTDFGHLKNLDLSMNKLDIKKEIIKLKSLPNLKVLSIVGNRIESTEIMTWNNDNSEIEIIF
jgi:hypothetical protein